MDILLSHGYFIAEDEHEQKIMKPYPPLGLLYISSHLKAKGFEVDLWDSTFATMKDFVAYVQAKRPSLVGLYCNLRTKHNILHMMRVCRAVESKIILGGPEPASYAREYLRAGADVVVHGEGELTLAELIPLFAKAAQPNLHGVAGTSFQDGDGRIIHNLPRPQIKDLDAQPWPDREAIDLEHYCQTWQTHHGVRSISLITARGCPYTCKWCSHSVFGHTHRRRSPADVADEVAWLVERYRPDQLWYADDVLTIVPRWFLRYADELKQRQLRLPFECISRADRLNEAVIDALADMGCYRLWIGAESGSQRILDAMSRKANIEDVQAKTRMLQARGIQVGMFIMLGYEGENISDIEATVDHLKTARPDTFLTTVAYPIKGTAYYEEVEHKIASNLDWAERTDRDLRVNGRYSQRFYDHATRWMVNEVNLHKARHNGDRDLPHLAKMYLNAWRGRLGMVLTGKNGAQPGGDSS
jgi:anaerobic magnesium-protoporphyrin IX monomethyl ester cyclase